MKILGFPVSGEAIGAQFFSREHAGGQRAAVGERDAVNRRRHQRRRTAGQQDDERLTRVHRLRRGQGARGLLGVGRDPAGLPCGRELA